MMSLAKRDDEADECLVSSHNFVGVGANEHRHATFLASGVSLTPQA